MEMTDNALTHHVAEQQKGFDSFFWHRLRWLAVSRFLPRTENFTLLDIGAGAGFCGDYLRRDFPLGRYLFLETDPELSAVLESRFGSASRVDPAAKAYEQIQYLTLLDVIEHIEQDKLFLRQVIEKIDPGVTVIITVPALPMLWSKWDELLGHHRRYMRRTLLKCIEGLPVSLVSLRYLFVEMLPLGLWRSFRSHYFAKGQKGHSLQSAEFPRLPAWLNQLLYLVGLAGYYCGGKIPSGTSLLMVIRKDP